MVKNMRKCVVCGTEYEYCSTCSRHKSKAKWMNTFHDEKCKNIYDICVQYNANMLTKTEAQEALAAYDLADTSCFKEHIQKDLVNIFAKEPKSKISKAVAKTESHEVVDKKEEEK